MTSLISTSSVRAAGWRRDAGSKRLNDIFDFDIICSALSCTGSRVRVNFTAG
jgi:hypothetical protein